VLILGTSAPRSAVNFVDESMRLRACGGGWIFSADGGEKVRGSTMRHRRETKVRSAGSRTIPAILAEFRPCDLISPSARACFGISYVKYCRVDNSRRYLRHFSFPSSAFISVVSLASLEPSERALFVRKARGLRRYKVRDILWKSFSF